MRRRRLVEDEDVSARRRGPGDLYELLMCGAQSARPDQRIDPGINGGEMFGGEMHSLPPANSEPSARLASENDVLRHRQMGAQIELLRGDGNSGSMSVNRGEKAHLRSIRFHGPLQAFRGARARRNFSPTSGE